jgi:hypothetical protein
MLSKWLFNFFDLENHFKKCRALSEFDSPDSYIGYVSSWQSKKEEENM